MSVLEISKMGHPVLRRRAREVEDPASPEIRTLCADMVETMRAAEGVGLAAPQVFQPLRIMVFFAPPESSQSGDPMEIAPLTTLINPVLEILDPAHDVDWEGCLSIPGLRGLVPRARHIRYSGLTPKGERVTREAKGLHARVVQHEYDHLEGVLYLDRMPDLMSLAFESELVHESAGR